MKDSKKVETSDKSKFQGKAQRSSKSRRSPSNKKTVSKPSNRRREGNDKGNAILEAATVESPTSSMSSMVFAGDSAAMGSFGNMITTPGQDNYINEFNHFINKNESNVVNFDSAAQARRTANIMVLDFMPYFGCVASDDGNFMSPIEMTALNLKQYIDTSFGTRTNYDPQDLAVYMMGVSAVFPLIAEIKRDLRLTQTYLTNQYPQFIPKGVFAALGIANDNGEYLNGEGLLYTSRNLRRFIDELNQLIITFNRLPMPPQIMAFGYNDDLYDHLYADAPDVQTAQLYAFRAAGYWTYSERSEVTDVGSEVIPHRYASNNHQSVDDKLALLATMIAPLTALRTSSSAMLQNLFNAFGSRDTVTVPTLDMNNLVPLDIVFDPNILTMIENSVMTGGPEFSNIQAVATGRIRGAVGKVTDDMVGVMLAPIAADLMPNIPLQFHKAPDQVTKEDIGWALRMHPAFLSNSKRIVQMPDSAAPTTRGGIWSVDYSGFAYLMGLHIVRVENNGTLTHLAVTKRGYLTSDIQVLPSTMAALMDFSTVPIMYVCTSSSAGSTPGITLTMDYYYARRDVELTYRLEDMKMHWVYLTMNVWGSNVNMNVVGSRTRS